MINRKKDHYIIDGITLTLGQVCELCDYVRKEDKTSYVENYCPDLDTEEKEQLLKKWEELEDYDNENIMGIFSRAYDIIMKQEGTLI